MAKKLRSDANQAREAASTGNGVQEQNAEDVNGEASALTAADADDALTDASWLPIAEGAAAAGVPLRTAQNWAKSGKLPTRRVAGVRTVHLGTLRRLARDRAGDDVAPATPALAAPSARLAPGDLDGDQAAALFEDFASGSTPLDLVRSKRLPPRVVKTAWREYVALRDAARDVRADRLAAVEETVARLGAAVFGDCVPEHVADLRAAVAQLQETISALPVPTRHAFTCGACGTIGLVATRVRCTACEREVFHGFHPEHE